MRRSFVRRHERRRNGYALIAVVWLTVLLTVVALEVSRRARLERLATLNITDDAVIAAALDASVEQMRSLLAERLAQQGIGTFAERDSVTGNPWGDLNYVSMDTMRLTNVRFTANASDVAAKLNINAAGRGEIISFLSAFGMSSDDAQAAVVSICARRDRLAKLDSRDAAQRADANGCASQSTNAFRSIDEFAETTELSAESWQLVRPFVTVLGSGRVNLHTASAPVLITLPGFTDEVIDAISELRNSGARLNSFDDLLSRVSFSARAVLTAARPLLVQRLTYETVEVEIRSQAWTDGGLYGESISLVRRGDHDLAPHQVRVR